MWFYARYRVCYEITQNPQGLDWHGPSADDAWGTVSALSSILELSPKWKAWAIASEKVVIIGHSNGGQGSWYNAARHPDRVAASNKNHFHPWHGLR
jgi:pimeloyl-ACP methyl ester carboxylesterase